MPCEPEISVGGFPERARRWRQVSGYFAPQRTCRGKLTGTHYTFPAAVSAGKGLRIVFFSDLHYTAGDSERKLLDDAAAMIAEFKPDYLLCGGDLVGHSVGLKTSLDSLKFFADIPCVKLAVPGNWESGKPWVPKTFWTGYFARYGFRYMENEIFTDRRCVICGLGDLSGRIVRPAWPEGAMQRLLFTHRPDNIVAVDSWRMPEPLAPVCFCGHLHGGQIRFPLIGPLYRRGSRYGARFDYGVYEHVRGEKMIITSGMGEFSCPVRFFCRREIVLVELQ